ncbi:fumarylacetoacetase, partial [Acinetobacter sp. A11]
MEQKLNSFIEVSPQSDFTIHNLPYGVFSRANESERQVGVAIGDWVIDLAALEKHGLLKLSEQDT